MPIAEADWAHAVRLLETSSEVALACHVDPDGDALGSMLALRQALERRGVTTHAGWSPGGGDPPGALVVPPQYTFLPGAHALTAPQDFPEAPELFMAFDCGSPERLGALRSVADRAGTVLVVDHHASGEAFGDVRLVDPAAPATAQLVAALIERLGVELDRDMAVCLYVGLVTDTGRFSYASTTAETMRLGARLLDFGIDHATINRRVWETHSYGYLKLLARALERVTLLPEAGLVWTAITQSDLDDLGIALAETEGLIDVLRAVETAECSLVLKEQPDGSWKTSLRSKGLIDVGALAERFGGGGHMFAAGFSARGPVDELVRRVADALGEPELAVARSEGG